jgi:hypothetical protein
MGTASHLHSFALSLASGEAFLRILYASGYALQRHDGGHGIVLDCSSE